MKNEECDLSSNGIKFIQNSWKYIPWFERYYGEHVTTFPIKQGKQDKIANMTTVSSFGTNHAFLGNLECRIRVEMFTSLPAEYDKTYLVFVVFVNNNKKITNVITVNNCNCTYTI
jgi:hypothetical protein